MGFHSGELAVQSQAGVSGQAGRLSGMVARGQLRSGTAEFLSSARLAVVTARDGAGRLWTSPLFGDPGFLTAADSTTLHIDSRLPEADPLHAMPDQQPAGAIVIDFATRRRWRINGELSADPSGGLVIQVDQSYGNCPKYIHTDNTPAGAAGTNREAVFTGDALRAEDRRLIQRADTFFLGTTHPASGADASHRGGSPGFVLTAHDRLWFPDYPGNNLFNSLGNIAVDPSAALLFLDFDTGTTLQLSGRATLTWDDRPADDGYTGRGVSFTPERVMVSRPIATTTAGTGSPAPAIGR
ncbi:pyridoxamine 5'-phosphate oxidase family protein [Mycobacterium sp. M26]|uniref:pyridoxamine 5'-phosphate oxidase family protein n=1 Tax=Mycobacterium sp. M26 TaxID=1762962 RepID=UPI00073ED120|nr:pyridoxamine 5'-phosphate oxidase family protein [Mycobacterium sp. M26]